MEEPSSPTRRKRVLHRGPLGIVEEETEEERRARAKCGLPTLAIPATQHKSVEAIEGRFRELVRLSRLKNGNAGKYSITTTPVSPAPSSRDTSKHSRGASLVGRDLLVSPSLKRLREQ